MHILFCRHIWAELSLLFWTFLSGTFFPGGGRGGGVRAYAPGFIQLSDIRCPITAFCYQPLADKWFCCEDKEKCRRLNEPITFKKNCTFYNMLISVIHVIVLFISERETMCLENYKFQTNTGLKRLSLIKHPSIHSFRLVRFLLIRVLRPRFARKIKKMFGLI